jgi:Tfp pilus assembly protein PilN
MLEPEFVPRWYMQLLRRRLALKTQAFATAALAVGLAVWAVVGLRQVRAADTALVRVEAQLHDTGIDLQRLNDLSTIQHQLERQDQIVRELGVNVPISRMLASLQELMPPRMALRELKIQTPETVTPLTEAERAKGESPKISRKLHLSLVGVAPTQDELATFLTELVAVPFFSEVALVKAEELSEKSHLMRSFQITFSLNLDDDQPHAAGVATASADGGPTP